MKKVLVIAPHPDDEVLGCGATIAKNAAQGHIVDVLIVSKGDPKLYDAERIKNVRREARKAHKLLSVNQSHFLDFHAPNLDTYAVSEIARTIASIIHKVQASILYLPHRGDIHSDHAVVFNAALVAARPVGNYSINEIYTYETLSETEWAPPYPDDHFIPTVFEDVTDFFDKKLKAMQCFESQLRKFPNPRSLENIEALAKYRGATISVGKAESFMLIRKINK